MIRMKRLGLGGIAAVGVTALVLGFSTAPATAAVKATFGNVVAAEPGSVRVPSGSTAATKSIAVAFDGPAATADNKYYMEFSDYGDPKIELSHSRVSALRVDRPYLSGSYDALNPATLSAASLRVYSSTTPGRYKLTIPITRRNYIANTVTQATVVKYVTIKANTRVSKSGTDASGSGRTGRTWKIRVTAPEYQRGAKVAIYAKVKGSKKYRKASKTLRLKQSSYKSKATLKVPGKYTKKGTRFYIKVGGVSYSSGYKATGYRIR